MVVAKEPSAFGAGKIDSATAYGLTESEKEIFKNREEIKKQNSRIFTLEQEVDKLSTMLEGILATTRSNSQLLQSQKQTIENLQNELKTQDEKLQNRDKEIESLHTKLDEQRAENQKIFAKIESNSKKTEAVINDHQKAINSSVSKNSFDEITSQLVAEIEANRAAIAKLGGKVTVAPKKSKFENEDKEKILQSARKDIDEKRYKEADEKLDFLISSDYKKAESIFYKGSSNYFTNQDDKALSLFKESARLDDKAYYMPILLYYSGIILERQENKQEARRFYETLIRLYPDHAVISGAKKRLEKL